LSEVDENDLESMDLVPHRATGLFGRAASDRARQY
jgi:hypothetical protein